MSAQNLTLLTDLYELTMMQGYFETQANETVIFDMFFRENPNKGGYSIMAGLDQVIEYIKNLNFSYEDVDYLRGLGIFSEDFLHYLSGFHFSGDIYAIPEGTVIFPREPLIKVVAPIMEAQLVETAILTIINHQCLIATKLPASFMRHRETELWNSAFAVPRVRTPGCTARELRLSAAVWELQMYWQELSLTYLFWELMRTAGS